MKEEGQSISLDVIDFNSHEKPWLGEQSFSLKAGCLPNFLEIWKKNENAATPITREGEMVKQLLEYLATYYTLLENPKLCPKNQFSEKQQNCKVWF